MRYVIVTLVLFIVLCLGCSTSVRVINFDSSEYYETDKDGEVFHCMSDFYLKQVLEAKIKKVNP